MISSMTGFGRAERGTPLGKVVVEIQSINRKYLEVFVSLPKQLSRFEHEIRKLAGEKVQRGLVSIRLYLLQESEQALPDPKALQTALHGWEKIATTLGYPKEEISFSFLIDHSWNTDQLRIVSEEEFAEISDCLREALQALDSMRKKEGLALAADLSNRLGAISHCIHQIQTLSPQTVEKQRQKLKERIEEVFSPGKELDERLLREVALFAERVDIAEEITRLFSHIAQFEELLKSKTGGMGRKMDFLVQEMGREINTIGSKATDAKIAHLVVDAKSELERMREQIQNIE